MRMRKTTQSFAAWIACLAILLAAFAPSLSHAWNAAQRNMALSMEICSVMGTAHVKSTDTSANSADPASASESAPTSHLEHCPFCTGHGACPAMPPVADLVLPAAQIPSGFPFLYYQAPRRLFVWSSAHSRAPPVLV